MKKKKVFLLNIFVTSLCLLASLDLILAWDGASLTPNRQKVQLEPVKSVTAPTLNYDVIVVGTDPEGVMAAVSAARNQARVLLVDGKDRKILGGLMTLGWLNSIDMNYKDHNPITRQRGIYNNGLFLEWLNKTEGDSFDVDTAANAFYDMVKKEPNIDLLLEAKEIAPLMDASSTSIQGIKLVDKNSQSYEIHASSVIDATQDADIAAAAGVPYTVGLEDMGNKNAKMAVTPVFRLKNVTEDVWDQIKKRLNGDDNPNTGANDVSAWGYGEVAKYPSTNPTRILSRGLNIGRQNDDTVLINSLHVFGIDPLDPTSRKEAYEIAERELPHLVSFLQQQYPEFANVEAVGLAPELYVRETRHIQGEYRLSIVDILENKDQWDRIAFGSYPVDIQRLTSTDYGMVVVKPKQYAVPFRSIVPQKIDNLLVVGRSASFDSTPHGSARVIPLGMATAEAAGVAAVMAQQNQITFRALSQNPELIKTLQDTLNKQGMDLQPFTQEQFDFMKSKYYPALSSLIVDLPIGGGYDNNFHYEKPIRANAFIRFIKLLSQKYPLVDLPYQKVDDSTITLDKAAQLIGQAIKLNNADINTLINQGFIKADIIKMIEQPDALTQGDAFVLLADLKEKFAKK